MYKVRHFQIVKKFWQLLAFKKNKQHFFTEIQPLLTLVYLYHIILRIYHPASLSGRDFSSGTESSWGMGGVVFGDISYSDESIQGIHEKLWKRCGDPGRQNDKEPRPGSSCRVQGKHNYEEKNEEDEEAAASI